MTVITEGVQKFDLKVDVPQNTRLETVNVITEVFKPYHISSVRI